MKDNKFDIEELVIRYCEGNVSESEKCDVENWMSESEENSEIVRKIYTLILATDTSIVCDKIDVDAAWMRMKNLLILVLMKVRRIRRSAAGCYGCNVLPRYYFFLY